METLDIIFLCCFVVAAIIGIKRGAVKQIASLLAVYLGITMAILYYPGFSVWLMKHPGLSSGWAAPVAFVLIFLAAFLVIRIVAVLVEKMLDFSLMGMANHLVGAVVALAICALVLSFLVNLADYANSSMKLFPNGKFDDSIFYNPLKNVSKTVFPLLRQAF